MKIIIASSFKRSQLIQSKIAHPGFIFSKFHAVVHVVQCTLNTKYLEMCKIFIGTNSHMYGSQLVDYIRVQVWQSMV